MHPSITKNLLKDALAFAQRYVDIKRNEFDLIFHTGKSLLYCKDTPWIKQERNGKFDVTIGNNNGAERYKILGLFLLYSIGEKFSKDDIGLYRDDRLASFKNNNCCQNDKIRLNMIQTSQTHGLKLEIKCNLKKVDYLDITFDLNAGSYSPYRKSNNDARYTNAKSNHSPSILKQIPAAISERISPNVSNKQTFQNAAPYYNNILR